jgi:ankyrin repeat protein
MSNIRATGTDINSPVDRRGWTRLHRAIGDGDQDEVRRLLALPDIDVNKVNNKNETPLLLAYIEDKPKIIKLLLDHPNIDINYDGILAGAIRDQDLGVVEMLLNHPKKVNIDNALLAAVEKRNEDLVRRLLARDDINVNLGAPLAHAIAYNAKNIAKMLLAHPDIDPNLGVPLFHATTYHDSTNQDIIKLLLDHPKIDPNILYSEPQSGSYQSGYSVKGGKTALMEAALHGFRNNVSQLLESPKVNVNTQNNNGETALHITIRSLIHIRKDKYYTDYGRIASNMIDVMKIILSDPNVNIDIRNNLGQTAYEIAPPDLKKIITDPARSLAEIAHKEKLPPEITSTIFEMTTGKKASLEDYMDRQFEFQHELKRKERQLQKEKRKTQKDSLNKGGKRAARKKTVRNK